MLSNLVSILIVTGEVVYLAYSSYDIKHPMLDDTKLPHVCASAVNTTLSSMFLALAVLLNINKWIYFTLRIQANINIRQYEIAELVAEERED